jgi:hypothetical protein
MAQEIARTSGETIGSTLSTGSTSTVAQAIATLGRFPKAGPKPAANAVERLFGCYPQATPNRPREYTAAVVSLLAEYPQEIVDAVCDPRSGVATGCKFLPTIAELTEALEAEMAPHRRAWREQYDKRTALPAPGRVEPSEESKERVRKLAQGIFREPDDTNHHPERQQG